MKIPPNAVVFRYPPGCVLRVGGADAATFLQGQFTNDLSKIAPGSAVYGLWLDRRGRVIGDSHVIQAPGGCEYWIVSVASQGAAIARHLGEHIIADEVDVSDETGGWVGISILGGGTGAWLSSQARPGLVFPGRRDAAENWEWLTPASRAGAAEEAILGARIAGAEEIERTRILSGIPSVPADIGPADLPNEGGLDVQAISY
jgi:folate-binding Fe-S cluster repair protein YgfZ